MSYIQNTSDLLRELDGLSVPEGAWLVALEVEAFYNSIPHTLGVEVVEGFIFEILTNNIFLFVCSHYLQILGVAMGTTSCAPSYANMYLRGGSVTSFFREDMQKFVEQIPIWRQYIDNIFFHLPTRSASLF